MVTNGQVNYDITLAIILLIYCEEARWPMRREIGCDVRGYVTI